MEEVEEGKEKLLSDLDRLLPSPVVIVRFGMVALLELSMRGGGKGLSELMLRDRVTDAGTRGLILRMPSTLC